MAKALAHFTVTRTGEDYLLMLEDEEGDTLEFTASFDLLDLITESIEDVLDEDEEEALGVDDDDGEEAAEE